MTPRDAICLGLAAVLTGCTVGPNYQRPKIDTPPAFRAPDSTQAGSVTEESLGDAKWWTVFGDPELQKLIRTALDKNYDLRIAAMHVLEAQSQVAIARADQLPTLGGVGLITGTRTPVISGGFPSFSYTALEAALSASWNPDFWGKYRRATEAARATMAASEWGRKAVVTSLIASIAAAYFQLRELDLQLEISRRTLAARQDSLKLTKTLADGGAASLIDFRQAEQLVETAEATIPDLERQRQQGENLVSVLLGENPGPVTRGLALADQPFPVEVPAGIPSRLLERRPDIRQTEQQLIAANAEIGVARAAFFPDISLTAIAGVESTSLTTLFRGPSRTWTWTGQAAQPIFQGGKLKANLRLAQQQQEEAVLLYKQTIQKAFSDVSNALIAYREYREMRLHEELLVTAAKSAADLSRMRYRGGAASYLEVLTNDTNQFAAELNLAGARLGEKSAVVQIYSALGGGWEQ